MRVLPANEAFHPLVKEERREEDGSKGLIPTYESNGEDAYKIRRYFVSNKIKFLCDDFQPYKAKDLNASAAVSVSVLDPKILQ